jgi:hypothetical protein
MVEVRSDTEFFLQFSAEINAAKDEIQMETPTLELNLFLEK